MVEHISGPVWTTYFYNLATFFFLSILGFELRALLFLGMPLTTWTIFSLGYFLSRVLIFAQDWTQTMPTYAYLHLLYSWDYKYVQPVLFIEMGSC
jgi:hypothetical protein